MKSIIVSDLHIGNIRDSVIDDNGLESKINEVFKQIDYIIDYAIEKNINRIFILGDIFNFKRPTPLYYSMFFQRLMKLEKNKIKTYLLLGNHDASNSSKSSLEPVKRMGLVNIHVIDSISNYREGVDKTNYIFIPHLTKNEIRKEIGTDEMNDDVVHNYLKQKINEKLIGNNNIIFGHLHYKGATQSSEEIIIQGGINFFPDIDKKRIKKVFLGHIHKFQILKYGNTQIVYIGSIVRCDFGERKDPKGFVVYDDKKNDWDFIELNTIQYKQININLIDKDYIDFDTDKIKKSTEGKVIKIVINVSQENYRKVNYEEIYREFSKYGYLSKVETKIDKHKSKKVNMKSKNPKEILNDYVNKNFKDNKNLNSILKLGNEIINEVIDSEN